MALVTRLAAAMLSETTEWLFPSLSFNSAARKLPSFGAWGEVGGCRTATSVGFRPAAMSAWTRATKSARVIGPPPPSLLALTSSCAPSSSPERSIVDALAVI